MMFRTKTATAIVSFCLVLIALTPVCTKAQDPTRTGIRYTNRELIAVGNLWTQIKCEWKAERERYKNRVDEINSSNMSQEHKEYFLQRESRYNRAESKRLAQKRAQVQRVLIDEANARAANGQFRSSDQIEATLGTPVGDRAHGGMKGDLDAQGGVRTADKVREVLDDMGLGHIKVDDQAGTLKIEGEFEMVVHKTGIEPQVGSEFHHVRNQVDARNDEVFLSERMRNRAAGTKQAGTDFVETQDHLKKALKGHSSTSQDLVSHPDRMQTMAKSTDKVLDIGKADQKPLINDDELADIIRRHNIQQDGKDLTPKQFRDRLQQIKERRLTLDEIGEVGRIREASKEIFAVAEQRTFKRAEDELLSRQKQLQAAEDGLKKIDAMSDNPATAERRRKMKESLRQRAQTIREELIDSRSKIQASKSANDDFRRNPEKQFLAGGGESSSAKGQGDTTQGKGGSDPPGGSGGSKKPGGDVPDAGGQGLGSRLKSGAGKVIEVGGKVIDVGGNIMDIADIGNACKTLEDYQEGKATLGQVVRSVVDMTPAGSLVGTVEKTGQSASDYADSSREIKKANETNMEAFLTQWELSLLRAGVPKEDAKKYVAQAVLAGNLDALEAKADRLRLQGKEVISPKLVIEDGPAPDGGAWYMWENTKEFGKGAWKSTKTGITYIVTAPGRTLTALGERELAEATLDYNSKAAESDMKTRLFRTLLNAGVDRKKALNAVQHGGNLLKDASREARKNLEIAKEAKAKAEAEAKEIQERIAKCLNRIATLQLMELNLKTEPVSPIPVPANATEDEEIPITVSMDPDFMNAVERIRREITSITGQTPNVTATYQLSPKETRILEPGKWELGLPAKADLYPVRVSATVSISGLTGIFAPMQRNIQRVAQKSILIKTATESITLPERLEFVDGDYEPITATLTGASDQANYFFLWTLGKESRFSDRPEIHYQAELNPRDVEVEVPIQVEVVDRITGSVVAEASSVLAIAPINAKTMIRKFSGKLSSITEVDEVQRFKKSTAFGSSAMDKMAKLEQDQWVRGYVQETGPEKDYYVYGRPHGRFQRYDTSGTVVTEKGTYRKGKKHGKWSRWQKDRESGAFYLYRVEHYINGELNGVTTYYRKDRSVRGVTPWKNGKHHGVSKSFSKVIPGGIREYHVYENGKSVEWYRWEKKTFSEWDSDSKSFRPVVQWIKTISLPDEAIFETYDANFVLIDRESTKDE